MLRGGPAEFGGATLAIGEAVAAGGKQAGQFGEAPTRQRGGVGDGNHHAPGIGRIAGQDRAALRLTLKLLGMNRAADALGLLRQPRLEFAAVEKVNGSCRLPLIWLEQCGEIGHTASYREFARGGIVAMDGRQGRMRIYAALMVLVLSGCSNQARLDARIARNEQAVVTQIARDICQNPERFRAVMAEGVARQTARALTRAGEQCVDSDYRYRLVRYEVEDAATPGGPRVESATLVAGNGPWTEVELRLAQHDGGVRQVRDWRIRKSADMPAGLIVARKWDATVKALRFVGVAFAVGLIGLGLWLIMRARRRKQDGRCY